jgi:hypothetical protein
MSPRRHHTFPLSLLVLCAVVIVVVYAAGMAHVIGGTP